MTLSYTSFVTPDGAVAPVVSGQAFTAPFTNTAVFANSEGPDCSDGEYRQYVMGYFQVNGSTLTHQLCGTVYMNDTDFQEDGCPSGSCTAYGHRSCPASPLDQYTNPNQATGSNFSMTDAPGFPAMVSGNSYVINLSFVGTLISLSLGTTLAIKAWTVEGTAVGPALTTALPPSVSLRPEDKVIGVHRSRNSLSKAEEVHLVIARKPGSAPLNTSATRLALFDAEGEPVPCGPGQAHDVVGKGRQTTTVVFPLPLVSKTPVTADLSANGLNVSFQIR